MQFLSESEGEAAAIAAREAEDAVMRVIAGLFIPLGPVFYCW